MRSLGIVFALGCAASALACSSILGLQEPTIDDGVADGNGADSPASDSAQEGSPGDGGGAPVQLFNARVRRIAVDDTSVYYTEMFDYVVGKIGKDGTGQVALGNGSAVTGYFPNTIAIDATDVFWTSINGIHQCAKAGCGNAPINVIDDNTSTWGPGAIGVDATTIYFVNYDENAQTYSIQKVPKGAANGTVTALVPTASLPCATINHMILDGAYVYFTCDEGPVARASTSSGAVEVLTAATPPPNPDTFVKTATSLYFGQFLEQATIYQMPVATGSTPSPIALTQAYVNGMGVDSNYLYWANVGVTLDNGGGTVNRCALTSCSTSTQTLATKIDVPTDLAVDTTSIYWAANGNGDTANTGVWKMDKPQ
ncbi:MAG TPA: hypothetical protein VGH28_05300 [Polyangiaceae bacterium]